MSTARGSDTHDEAREAGSGVVGIVRSEEERAQHAEAVPEGMDADRECRRTLHGREYG